MSHDQNQKPKNFVIVEFISRGRKPSTKNVDNVPVSWVMIEKKNSKNTFKSYYPPAPYDGVQSMVKNRFFPQKSWEKYTVHVLRDAGTYRLYNQRK